MAVTYGSGFKIVGKLTKLTELTSKKNSDWRGYIFEISTLGKKLEVQVDQREFVAHAEGEEVEVSGDFDHFGNRLQLIAKKIRQADAGEAAGRTPAVATAGVK